MLRKKTAAEKVARRTLAGFGVQSVRHLPDVNQLSDEELMELAGIFEEYSTEDDWKLDARLQAIIAQADENVK